MERRATLFIQKYTFTSAKIAECFVREDMVASLALGIVYSNKNKVWTLDFPDVWSFAKYQE